MLKRILLDTNIILTGSLCSNSYAAQLRRLLSKEFSFLVPNDVIWEAKRVIQEKVVNKDTITAAFVLIDLYIQRLNALIVNELVIDDDIDKAIANLAEKYGCEFICTYNIKHFQEGRIRVLSPLALVKEFCGNGLQDFLPFLYFGEEGTVLFHGTLTHPSSLGEILRTNNGIEVYVDENGIVQIKGPTVNNIRNQIPLPAILNQYLFLILRYNRKFFEARRWAYENQQWEVLCVANAQFQMPIYSTLGTTGRLNAIINDYSAIPRFVRNKQLQTILRNGCLENTLGSGDIVALLSRLRIKKIAEDQWEVTC